MAERISSRGRRLLVAVALVGACAAALVPTAGAAAVKLRLTSVSVTLVANGTVAEAGRAGVFDGPYSRKVEVKVVLTGKPLKGKATTTVALPPQKDLYACSPDCPRFVLSGTTTVKDVVTPDDTSIPPVTCTRKVAVPTTFDGKKPVGAVTFIGASAKAFGPNLELPNGLLFFASTAKPDANGCQLAAPHVNDAGYALVQLQDASLPVKALKSSATTVTLTWQKFATLDQYGGFSGLVKATAKAVFEKVG